MLWRLFTLAANLKRELPRIPFAPEFHPFAKAGKRLTEIHINYEQQPEYCLKHIENKDLPIDWRVEKMRLSKDKTQIKYNDFLTLTGIPLETFEYKLGNRSALDWINVNTKSVPTTVAASPTILIVLMTKNTSWDWLSKSSPSA